MSVEAFIIKWRAYIKYERQTEFIADLQKIVALAYEQGERTEPRGEGG